MKLNKPVFFAAVVYALMVIFLVVYVFIKEKAKEQKELIIASYYDEEVDQEALKYYLYKVAGVPSDIEVVESQVKVTVYHAVASQTDDTPHITADETVIDVKKAGEYRYCAISRDLLQPFTKDATFKFGDIIFLHGTGKYDGKWYVKDTMHERKKKQIDLLVYPTEMYMGTGTITF